MPHPPRGHEIHHAEDHRAAKVRSEEDHQEANVRHAKEHQHVEVVDEREYPRRKMRARPGARDGHVPRSSGVRSATRQAQAKRPPQPHHVLGQERRRHQLQQHHRRVQHSAIAGGTAKQEHAELGKLEPSSRSSSLPVTTTGVTRRRGKVLFRDSTRDSILVIGGVISRLPSHFTSDACSLVSCQGL